MSARPEEIAALRQSLEEATRTADAASRRYERWAWIGYAIVFVPIPFFVALFRLHLEGWHYYIVGGAFLAVMIAMYVVDVAKVAKRDEAIEAARRAREALERASGAR